MGVYERIVEWSAQRPLWQRDALRRLAVGGESVPEDIATWVQMALLEAQGKPCGAVPLTQAHVPADGGAGACVSIAALSELRNVNAIADQQQLHLAETGVTAIYGDNGAGKSGYARILRTVCHARGAADPVLPNVFSEAQAVPSARIHFRLDGDEGEFDWQVGVDAPGELARVAVFDSLAANALLEQDNEVLWTPGGLDLLLRLAEVVKSVKQELSNQESARSISWRPPLSAPGTAAAAFVAKLNKATTTEQIEALQLTSEEQAELPRIEVALKAPDPLLQAGQIEQQAARIRGLHDRVAALEGLLSTSGVSAIHAAWQRLQDARAAELALASSTFSDSAVPGVGTGPWGVLWRAAEAFAEAGATSDGAFPSGGSPSLCVLCQQPVEGVVRDRLARFHAFVRNDVSTKRSGADAELKALVRRVQQVSVPDPVREPVIAELADLDPENAKNFPDVLDAASACKNSIAGLSLNSSTWPSPTPLPEGWSAWLLQLVSSLQSRARALRAAARPEEKRKLEVRKTELESRRALFAVKDQICSEVERLKALHGISAAKRLCSTRAITAFGDGLTKEYVSDRMMEAFTEQAEALRIGARVEYGRSSPRAGRSFQRIRLHASGWADRQGPSRVLSEGERRAVSLAAFLAELSARSDRSGVVFDDPVSSLDHNRRNLVAYRLVECARERQVVVFTHDLVFLHMLKAASVELGVALTDREIRRAGPLAGYCRSSAPPKAMRVKALVGELRVLQQRCAAQYRAGDVDQFQLNLTQGYGLLREAWERAVEELLFNQAVMRFDHRIQTQRLKHVHDISPEDIATIDAGMTTCSKWLPGHALASAINEQFPEPQDLLAEVKRLEEFVGLMRNRGRS
jgi:ABC-type hemin transport system ATPase subunit